MTEKNNNFLNKNYLILILLAFHFLVNIAIYFNTNTFYDISESGNNFDSYYSLIRGDRFPPMHGYFFLTPAYIAFFINKLFGSGLFYYFIFQVILSTVTVFVMFRFIIHITKSMKLALFGVLLITFYLEYDLLGSVFYNQIYEIFFVSVFLLMVIVIDNEKKIPKLAFFILMMLVLLFLSMFFRKTLIFAYLLFIFLLLFNVRNKTYLLKYSVLAISSFIILYFFNPYKMYNSDYYDETVTLFWGHTMYGGNGGEGSFVYPENEKRYDMQLKQYMSINHIDSLTRDVDLRFRRHEIKEFITKEPLKWLLLQVRKVVYLFGSVPQKDGLLILYKGKIKMHWAVSAIILQFSYAIILILFILCVDLNYKKMIRNSYTRMIYFIGIYLISGISIFSFYQERFRMVVFVCFFIPVIAVNFERFKYLLLKENRRELIIKLMILLILFAVWMYQAYEALYIYHDRYFKALQ